MENYVELVGDDGQKIKLRATGYAAAELFAAGLRDLTDKYIDTKYHDAKIAANSKSKQPPS